jgi:hypothetical protein
MLLGVASQKALIWHLKLACKCWCLICAPSFFHFCCFHISDRFLRMLKLNYLQRWFVFLVKCLLHRNKCSLWRVLSSGT